MEAGAWTCEMRAVVGADEVPGRRMRPLLATDGFELPRHAMSQKRSGWL
jgi:hypothetical protein